MIRVEGKPHLYRDETGAIINDDSSGYSAYMNAKSKKALERKELDTMKQEIIDLSKIVDYFINYFKQ